MNENTAIDASLDDDLNDEALDRTVGGKWAAVSSGGCG